MDIRQMQTINHGVNTGKMQILHQPIYNIHIQTDTPTIDMNMEDPTNDDIDAEVMMDSDLRNENDDKDEDDNDINNEDNDDEGNDDELNDDTPTIDTAATQQLPPTLQQPPQLHYPYQCCMEITLPIHQQNISTLHSQQRNTNHTRRNMAKDLQRILQVDPELTKQTYKVITTRCSNDDNSSDDDDGNSKYIDDVLVVHFYATQCKGLRVSISSFLEYIQVALKCYQEFT